MPAEDTMCCLRMKRSSDREALLPVTAVNVIIKALPQTGIATVPFSCTNATFYRPSTSILFSVTFQQREF